MVSTAEQVDLFTKRSMDNVFHISLFYIAVTRIGITVAESSDPSLDRRVPCCSGYLTATVDARNCTKMGGECCSREHTDYPGAGGMGLSIIVFLNLKLE